jgi:hypothetical protein
MAQELWQFIDVIFFASIDTAPPLKIKKRYVYYKIGSPLDSRQ